MRQAIAYYRVSTDNQKEEKTIELQRLKVREYAEKNGYELISEFEDNGVSGSLRYRPGLNLLIDALQITSAEVVIIYKLDRLARDLHLQEGLILQFQKYDKQLISTLEPDLDSTDPFRKAFRQMLGVFAEFEKAMIALRLEGGRERKAQQGGWHGGRIYGYKNFEGTLLVDPAEAETIKTIYKMRRRKKTYSQIARHLTQHNIKTKRGNEIWRISTVRKILKNPIYKKGVVRYKGGIYSSSIEIIVN
jgi:site-specific DNA recombinase